jgi:hypothetical protein
MGQEPDPPAPAAPAREFRAALQLVEGQIAQLLAELDDQRSRIELRGVTAIETDHPDLTLRLPGIVQAGDRAGETADHENIVGTPPRQLNAIIERVTEIATLEGDRLDQVDRSGG